MGTGFAVRARAATDDDLELRVERYLAGELSPAETLAFEEALAQPELGKTFREILLIRELLHSAPPHDVPPGLNERIARALESEMGASARSPGDASRLARRSRIVRDGFFWIYRGPGMALAGLPAIFRSRDTLNSDAETGGETRSALAKRAFSAAASATGSVGNLGVWALRRIPRSYIPALSSVARLRGAE